MVQRDLEVLWHPCSQMKDHESVPLIPIKSGQGVWLEDFEGKRYLDAISSWWVNIFGHANPVINQAYAPDGGIRSAGASAALSYRFSQQWAATGYARWDRLLGPAADSPVPKAFGSLNQFSFGGSMAYSFDTRF